MVRDQTAVLLLANLESCGSAFFPVDQKSPLRDTFFPVRKDEVWSLSDRSPSNTLARHMYILTGMLPFLWLSRSRKASCCEDD